MARHLVYIIKCADGTYYTGYTTDLDKRLSQHNEGKGAKYTRGRSPVELVHKEEFKTRRAAMKREYEIKQLTREEKERVIEGE
jgi:putative endonuclease